jgi:hypothetical protein
MKDFHKILLAVAFLAAALYAQEPPAAADTTAAEPDFPAVADTAAADTAVPSLVMPPPPPGLTPPPNPEPRPEPPPQQAAEPKKSEPVSIKLGGRMGFGISGYRSHIALVTSDRQAALRLKPALAFSIGADLQIGFNRLFSLSPELQYSLLRSNSEAKIKDQNSQTQIDGHLRSVGVRTHALEMPVMARFRFASMFYAEAGPQLGLNLSSEISKDAERYRPDENLLAFGAAAGGGVSLSGVLLGVRGYFGFLEYAGDAKGVPWSVQLTAGAFIF